MDGVMILAGLVGLMVGGDLLVRGAVAVATRAGLSPMVIGLTLVGFGTFEVRDRAARTGRNPRTGAPVCAASCAMARL